MRLLDLLRSELTERPYKLLALAGVAGGANALVLAIVNNAASASDENPTTLRDRLLFVLVLLLFIAAQRWVMTTATREVEMMICRLRMGLVEKIRGADLMVIEHIGRSEIYAGIVRDTQTISQTATVLVVGAQSAMIAFFTVFYIAYLSLMALALVVAFTTAVAYLHLKRSKKLSEQTHAALRRENELFDGVTDLLDGFKEVKMCVERSRDLSHNIQNVAADARDLKILSVNQWNLQLIFSQVSVYLLLAITVFVLPEFSHVAPETVVKTTTAVLFIIGPISSMVQSIPMFATANAAAENLFRQKERLERAASREAGIDPKPLDAPFRSVEMSAVTFRHLDEKKNPLFTVGPVDLSISAGEIVFVTGGNGSGKSTLIKLLTGLYYPEHGLIKVNGRPLGDGSFQSWRSMMSVVFSDYHLFTRLYGLNPSSSRAEELLDWFEIRDKTRLVEGRFEVVDLSAGQRKRLALIVALFEDKPVLVLDEWAADQDPVFRRKFYREILPRLRAEGKTIIAVTHDDQYFDLADRRLRMVDGHLAEEAVLPAFSPPIAQDLSPT